MSKYSGLLFAAEEHHCIGPFRFPILRTLLPGEAQGMRRFERQQAQGSYDSMRLAKKIATDKNIKPKEAIALLQNASQDDDLIFDYIEDMQSLNDKAPDETAQLCAYTTLALQFRGEVKLTPEADYIKTPDWSESDTQQIPVSMQQEINQFLNWERNGWPILLSPEGDEGKETPKTSTSTKPSSTATAP